MSRIVFETSVNLVETFIMVEFITKYLGGSIKYGKARYGFFITWILMFTELCIINCISVMEGVAVFIPVAVLFIYAVFCLPGNIYVKLWAAILTEAIVVIIAIATNLFVCAVIGYNPIDMITVFNFIRIVSVIITKLLLFYITRMILKVCYRNPLDRNVWFVFILMPVVSIVSLSALMLVALDAEELSPMVLCGMGGTILAVL